MVDLCNCTRLEALEHFVVRQRVLIKELEQLLTDVASYRENVAWVEFDTYSTKWNLDRNRRRLRGLEEELVKERAKFAKEAAT